MFRRWQKALVSVCILVALIWMVEVVNHSLGHRLNLYGIYPRETSSLPGVLLWSFLHGNFYHLVMNTTPLLLMGYFVALQGPIRFIKITVWIIVAAGLLVWLMAREAYHVGASGLVFGYFGYIVALSLYERSIASLAIASVTLFYYGGMFMGILPSGDYISSEAHLAGLVAGCIAARMYFRRGRS